MKTIPLVNPPQSRSMKAAKVLLSPGEEIGEHVTEDREEVIVVLRGKGMLLRSGDSVPLEEGHVHHVKKDTLHNVRNDSDSELEYVYVVCLNGA